MENVALNQGLRLDEAERMRQAIDALRNVPPERAISAMPVLVPYKAIIGRVTHYMHGEEHCFGVTRTLADGTPGEHWQEKLLNAHAVRDEFLNVKEWSGAFEFLSSTGIFSPLGDKITWSEFQRWQEFARLVLEHSSLASAMQQGHWRGEHGEALKALSGDYPNSFIKTEQLSEKEIEEREEEKRRDPDLAFIIQQRETSQELKRRAIFTWFRRPRGEATSIEWFPKEKEDADAVLPELRKGGAMIEFLLPRVALRPALVIRPSTTLEAIGATIFADYCNGVEYRTCEFCKRLFPVGRQKTKRFCNQARCKNAAHSKKVRAAQRGQKSKKDEVVGNEKGR